MKVLAVFGATLLAPGARASETPPCGADENGAVNTRLPDRRPIDGGPAPLAHVRIAPPFHPLIDPLDTADRTASCRNLPGNPPRDARIEPTSTSHNEAEATTETTHEISSRAHPLHFCTRPPTPAILHLSGAGPSLVTYAGAQPIRNLSLHR